MSHKVGLMLGKFYPIHYGHINMVFEALTLMDEVHVIICSETIRDHQLYQKSHFTCEPTPEDRLEWAKRLFNDFPNIHLHHLNEDGLPPYPKGWQEWTERTLQFIDDHAIHPTHIFSSEVQDKPEYEALFNLPVILVDSERHRYPISATKIRTDPYRHWDYIPAHIRIFFSKSIGIAIGDHSLHPLISMLSTMFNAPLIPSIDHKNSYQSDAPKLFLIDEMSSCKPEDLQAIITDQPSIKEHALNHDIPHLYLDPQENHSQYYADGKAFITQLLNY